MPIAQTTSWLATVARSGRARKPRQQARQEKHLVLYEYEGCPMCRRVREAVTDLGLTVEVRPCPVGGTRFRPEAEELAGKVQFPFLVDPNHDVAMLESTDIVEHLYRSYGDGKVPTWLLGGSFVMTSQLASMLRLGRGAFARPSRPADGLVELRGNESDPAARRVREVLCELQVPWVRTAGELRFHDPSSATTLESADEIIDWVRAAYADVP